MEVEAELRRELYIGRWVPSLPNVMAPSTIFSAVLLWVVVAIVSEVVVSVVVAILIISLLALPISKP